MGPTPPEWLQAELKLVDPCLGLEWDRDREAFYLVSRRGQEVVPYGLFELSECTQMLVDSVREAIRARDSGVSVKKRLADRKAARDAKQEVHYAELRDFTEAQAEREVGCAHPSFSWAMNGPARGHNANRLEGILRED